MRPTGRSYGFMSVTFRRGFDGPRHEAGPMRPGAGLLPGRPCVTPRHHNTRLVRLIFGLTILTQTGALGYPESGGEFDGGCSPIVKSGIQAVERRAKYAVVFTIPWNFCREDRK